MPRALIAIAGVLLAASARGQRVPTSVDKGPAFEVASTKRNRSGDERSGFSAPGNRFVAANVTLRELIAWAYGDPGPPPEPRPGFQMSGEPAWSTTDRFDV